MAEQSKEGHEKPSRMVAFRCPVALYDQLIAGKNISKFMIEYLTSVKQGVKQPGPAVKQGVKHECEPVATAFLKMFDMAADLDPALTTKLIESLTIDERRIIDEFAEANEKD